MSGDHVDLMDITSKCYQHVVIEGLSSSLHSGLTPFTPFEQWIVEEKDMKKSKFAKKYSKPWKNKNIKSSST